MATTSDKKTGRSGYEQVVEEIRQYEELIQQLAAFPMEVQIAFHQGVLRTEATKVRVEVDNTFKDPPRVEGSNLVEQLLRETSRRRSVLESDWMAYGKVTFRVRKGQVDPKQVRIEL